MAKALLGYVGGPDPRLVSELRRLQQRVQDLETELLRLQAEYDHLSATVDANHLDSTQAPAATLDRGEDVRTVTPEPVLA
jgi:uncharacterized protein YlxW (UPF0749 family)